MNIVICIALTLVLIGAGVIVFTGKPSRQAVALSVYGLLLTIVFMAVQAPDVALSQLAIGTAVVPLLVMLAVRKIASVRREREEQAAQDHDDPACEEPVRREPEGHQ